MSKKSLLRESPVLLISVPLFLLLVSVGLGSRNSADTSENFKINPYLEDLPQTYHQFINEDILNDSTFFFRIQEKPINREVVIFKINPTLEDIKTKFEIKIELDNTSSSAENIVYTINSEASKFNFKNHSVAVFKHSIPIMEINKIEVSEIGIAPKSKGWKSKLNGGISAKYAGKFDGVLFDSNLVLEKPNVYNFSLQKVLQHYNIPFNKGSYVIKNDSLFWAHWRFEKIVENENINGVKIINDKRIWNKLRNGENLNPNDFQVFGASKEDLVNAITNESTISNIFDLERLALFNAVRDLFSMYCDEPLYFTFNEDSNLLEPYYYSSNCFGGSLNILYGVSSFA